ncbi:MAG: hypothetical protein AB8B69_03270 [Chitinophagales bacterium]
MSKAFNFPPPKSLPKSRDRLSKGGHTTNSPFGGGEGEEYVSIGAGYQKTFVTW